MIKSAMLVVTVLVAAIFGWCCNILIDTPWNIVIALVGGWFIGLGGFAIANSLEN